MRNRINRRRPPCTWMCLGEPKAIRMPRSKQKQFVLCVRNEDAEDLDLRKIYEVLPDRKASQDGYLRVIDESGEDYLYRESYFVAITLPAAAREACWSRIRNGTHPFSAPFSALVGRRPHLDGAAVELPPQPVGRRPYCGRKSCTTVTSRTCRLSGSKTRIFT